MIKYVFWSSITNTYAFMTKITSKKLSKQLAKYSALTVAIGGIADANGQINYTDVQPDFAGGIGSEFFLDLDNNGTNDFRIFNDSSNNLLIEPLAASNQFLGSGSSSSYAYPYALSNGAPISASAAGSWFNNGYSMGQASLNYGSSSSTCSFGNWCDVTDRYLPLRFDVGGNTHYGWARLDVDAIGNVWSVKDYAYNETADEVILAGQQTLTVETSSINDIKIVSLNKTIGLYNLQSATSYRLLNMTGKEVLKGNTLADHSFVIDANSIANGVYIIELTDSNSKAVTRKKLVL